MLRVIQESQPRYVFWENSDRARNKGLNHVCRALQENGFGRIAWGTISAGDLGAPHLRRRMWLMAKRGGRAALAHFPKDMPADGILDGPHLVAHAPWLKRRPRADMPTLTVGDVRNSGNRPIKTEWTLSDVLGTTAKHRRHGKQIMMPMLAASDFRAPYTIAGLLKQLQKRSKPLRDILPYLEGGRCISPLWAEWYMGWCPDWTDLTVAKPDVATWKAWTKALRWWGAEVEASVLPRTLPARPKDLVGRITALGNGQVPVVAAAAFRVLQQAVDD